MSMTPPSPFLLLLLLAAAASSAAAAVDGCSTGCDLAVAAYTIVSNQNLSYIASLFGTEDFRSFSDNNIRYSALDFIPAGDQIIVNFTCRCLALPGAPLSTYLAGSFPRMVSLGDTYDSIAADYSNLTTGSWLQATNTYSPNNLPIGGTVNVTVNCSCGDPAVSPNFQLFLTYPLKDQESLSSAGTNFGFLLRSEMDLLKRYNPGMEGGARGSRLVYIPLREGFVNRATVTDPLRRRKKTKTAIIVAAGFSAGLFGLCIIILLVFVLCCKRCYYMLPWRKGSRNAPRIESFLQKQGAAHPKRYTYSEVRRMTKCFAHKLGQGGYGSVYRGKLPDGREIAVKMLKDTEGDGEEFMNEVASISRTSHLNVVTLIGFCLQGSKRALIYEYMSNGSLDKYIFGSDPAEGDNSSLTWEKLFDIVVGVARGLEYLHSGCNTRIVHFDIKPHNILLDQDFRPKISDFGLAKLCRQKESEVSIAGARGTIGYIAPEVIYRNYRAVSSKFDVYSYGMVVLEMLGARKQIEVITDSSSSKQYFPQWLYDNLDQFCRATNCEISSEVTELVRKMTIVGLWCIQFAPADRPSMSKVLEMLESSTMDLQMPPKAFYAG